MTHKCVILLTIIEQAIMKHRGKHMEMQNVQFDAFKGMESELKRIVHIMSVSATSGGANVAISGVVDNLAGLPGITATGTLYYVTDDKSIYMANNVNGSLSWKNIGDLKGSRGATGAKGADGIDGSDGQDGAMVIFKGGYTETNIMAEVKGGNVRNVVYILSANLPSNINIVKGDAVIWNGTSIEKIFSTGGKNGKDGPRGLDGHDGADGKSAYQLAVNNGYVGTESSWIASLSTGGTGSVNPIDMADSFDKMGRLAFELKDKQALANALAQDNVSKTHPLTNTNKLATM